MDSNDFTLSQGGQHLELENNDIEDWNITFVDTGLNSNIDQRLTAVRKYVENEEMFLANYADGLIDMDLPAMIHRFRESGKLASFVASPPSQSFHLVDVEDNGEVTSLRPVSDSNLLINAGFFCLRPQIFDYMEPGEELVFAPSPVSSPSTNFLPTGTSASRCMDTFKEQQELTDIFNAGTAPWEVWKAQARS